MSGFVYTGSQDPQCNGSIDSTYVTDIQNAIQLAPDPVQDDICKLTNIFVTDDPSFGIWNPTNQHTFIGLNKSEFNKKYSDIEVDIHNNLIAKVAKVKTTIAWQIAVDPSALNTMPEFGLLSVMAHELGHIDFVQNLTGFLANWSLDCKNAPMCFYNDFICNSWDQGKVLVTWRSRRWTKFGDDVGTRHSRGIAHFSDITSDSNTPDVCKILNGKEFAGLFGSVSPDEDYVEMYRLNVLLNAKNMPLKKITTTLTTKSGYSCPSVTIDWSKPPSRMLIDKLSCAHY
jgi:hypothetical protein